MSRLRPFDQSGIARDTNGMAHYRNRPPSLVGMLRATVDATPEAMAIIEIGGESIRYRELWDRAATVAGGLRALGIRRGDRVAIRLLNGAAWCVAFFGCQLAGAIAVPVNTR